ncbi:hypothetical protein VCHA53O466_40111 [Vibrio chagasii]|nr:hypothetical protein VCHA53O466_40111 [Vibrio chagasii]
MYAFSNIPEPFLKELPKSVVEKILSGVDLGDTDSNVARMYLDSTFTHPELISHTPEQLTSVLALYMHVDAKLSVYALRDYGRRGVNPEIMDALNNYHNVIDRPVIMLKMSSEGCGGFRSFRIMNADRGYASWSFYAENLNKLGRHMERWIKSTALHLRCDYSYDIYIDKVHIAKIEHGEFSSLPDEVVYDSISEVFGRPIYLSVDFQMMKSDLGDLDAFSLKGVLRQYPHIQSSAILAIPKDTKLAHEYMQGQVNKYVKSYITKHKNEAKVITDIGVAVFVNGMKVGNRDLCSLDISYFQSSKETLLSAVGRPTKDERGYIMRLLAKLFS